MNQMIPRTPISLGNNRFSLKLQTTKPRFLEAAAFIQVSLNVRDGVQRPVIKRQS